jgi:hypothetical protein
MYAVSSAKGIAGLRVYFDFPPDTVNATHVPVICGSSDISSCIPVALACRLFCQHFCQQEGPVSYVSTVFSNLAE